MHTFTFHTIFFSLSSSFREKKTYFRIQIDLQLNFIQIIRSLPLSTSSRRRSSLLTCFFFPFKTSVTAATLPLFFSLLVASACTICFTSKMEAAVLFFTLFTPFFHFPLHNHSVLFSFSFPPLSTTCSIFSHTLSSPTKMSLF
uniref:(northern house mosquito) hypothetical protein n=1 Tax=Culex pipiens TaxID=7175 RepID=A0A8D8K8Q0_CULPI